MPATAAKPFAGIFPIAPTPFTESGALDVEGQRRVLDCMIDQGVDGICILANYSEQFLLTDEERATLLDVCMTHVGERVPVIVTCSHYSTRIASDRARAAAAAGAADADADAPLPWRHAARRREGDARAFRAGGRGLRPADHVPGRAVERRQRVGALPRAARARGAGGALFQDRGARAPRASSRSLIESGGDAIAGPFDGEESITLMADLDAGATGTMPSALLPDLIKPVLEHHRAGHRAEAAAAYARILPLINFENRQCGLRATKTVMAEGGVIRERRRPASARGAASRDQGGLAGARPRGQSARAALGSK